MRIKITTLLLVITLLVLVNSCSVPRYVTVENQVYAQPGDKVIIEVTTGLISVKGIWSSFYGFTGGENTEILDVPLEFSLRDSVSSNEITTTVLNRVRFDDYYEPGTKPVIIQVEITVPSNAVVPSTWSGFLKGKIRIPNYIGGTTFREDIEDLDIPITLHVTTQDEITKAYRHEFWK
jgi:hypothetical protein